jgi:hypothetical protein
MQAVLRALHKALAAPEQQQVPCHRAGACLYNKIQFALDLDLLNPTLSVDYEDHDGEMTR